MHQSNTRFKTIVISLFFTLLWLGNHEAHAETQRQHVSVPVSGSYRLKTGKSISRVSVATPDIADVAAFPPNEIFITGKRIGITSATIWLGREVLIIEITVGYPLDAIREELIEALPNAKGIEVRQAGAAIVLSGRVSGIEAIAQADEIATAFMEVDGGKGHVINTMTVHGEFQVQLDVKFAEVSRSSLRQIGLNFWSKRAKVAGGLVAPANSVASVLAGTDADGLGLTGEFAVPLIKQPLGSSFGAVFSSVLGDFPFSAALSLLANRGYARVMAEPSLVAMSGKKASFLAGGEFPIPVPQGLGSLGVEFKKFGIQVEFQPTVVNGSIQLAVSTIVSDIDFSLGLKLAGVTVPGLTQRSASSTVRLKDGQSFVLAGLLSDRVRSSVDKVPGLGDLPVLGVLFRSNSYRREETELLVVVTAHLVRPLKDQPELPGEGFQSDPSDLELFLLGHIESMADDSSTDDEAEEGEESASRLVPAGAIGFMR